MKRRRVEQVSYGPRGGEMQLEKGKRWFTGWRIDYDGGGKELQSEATAMTGCNFQTQL
jgi:hypothetical protein